MFRNLPILFLFLLVFASCTRPVEKGKDFSTGSLIGKWEYMEHYFSIGGPGKWQPVQPAGQVVDFKSDGTFTSAASFSGTFLNYEVIDSTTVKFSPASTASGYVLMRYEIDAAKGTLLLHPIEPMCIEGCGHNFKRRP